LREGSAGEADDVARICADRAIPHETLVVEVSPDGNLQANARGARYAALAAWLRARELAALVTAHHADDQAETLLMRLNRGAGVRGLAAMRAVSPVPGSEDLPLLRPLLGWSRDELAAVVARSGLAAAADPSNVSPRFDRVRVRQGLAGADWLDPGALARSATHLAEADAALDWAARREWDEHVDAAIAMLSYRPSAPRAVRLRVLEAILVRLGSGVARGPELSRWHDSLEAGGTATLAGVRGEGRGAEWRFTVAPPHRT
jgi:tRNA(Ile)-lysidine synthase